MRREKDHLSTINKVDADMRRKDRKWLAIYIFSIVFGIFALTVFNGEVPPTTGKVEMIGGKNMVTKSLTPPEEEKVEHVVVKGDSIEGIASKYTVLPWLLRKENNLKKGVVLQPGDVLQIPKIDWTKKSYVGKASWYGPGFHGKPRADTKRYNQNHILIAHRTFPINLPVRLTNLKNGKSIVVPVKDRGPYAKDEYGNYTREVDLSKGAAKLLEAIEPGVIDVLIEPLNPKI